MQKRRLEILCCLLVAVLLNYSPSEHSKMAAINSHATAVVSAPLCLYATVEAETHLSSKNKHQVSSLLKTEVRFWKTLNM